MQASSAFTFCDSGTCEEMGGFNDLPPNGHLLLEIRHWFHLDVVSKIGGDIHRLSQYVSWIMLHACATRRRESFGSTDQSWEYVFPNLSTPFRSGAQLNLWSYCNHAERFDNIILSCVRKRTDYE